MSWNLAWRNLQRNKRRSFSTGLAICVGFVALNLLAAYIYRTFQTLTATAVYMDQRGHVQIRKAGSVANFDSKPKDYLIRKTEIAELQAKLIQPFKDQIEYTGELLSTPGLLSNGQKSHPIYAIGFENESYVRSIKHPEMAAHGFFFLMPWQREKIDQFGVNKELIAVTPLISRIMGFKQPLEANESVQIATTNIDGDLNAINADLGALHSTGAEFLESSVVLVPIVKLQELMGTDGVQALTVFLKNRSQIANFEKTIEQFKSGLSFPIEFFRYSDTRVNAYFEGTMGFLYVMGGFFFVLICIAVSLTIINSLTMGIIERTREIGTLRAIGFKQEQVKNIFIQESILISLVALFFGTIVSGTVAGIVNRSDIMFEPPGTPNKIPFTLLWNLYISTIVAILLMIVAWMSSVIVIQRKLKNKLISLLHDIGESEE